ncbi:unnamed protein product [Rotaria sp. Silwood1]|nr:unnamed protein product [Rotaria sp. Silwood1]
MSSLTSSFLYAPAIKSSCLCDYIVRIECQTCQGTLPYDSCSSNTACGCLRLASNNDNSSICAYLSLSCSKLISCAPNNQTCYQPRHVCVEHPRCQNRPLCYPIDMTTREICPLVLPTTTGATTPMIPDDGICASAKWNPNGTTVIGGKGSGSALDQLYFPSHIIVDRDSNVYITDSFNHRIVKWAPGTSSGQVVAGGNGPGNGTHQLAYPEGFAIDKNGSLFICDPGNRRVQRWYNNDDHGTTIMFDTHCWGIVIDDEGLVYISDSVDYHRVITWPDGRTVAGGNGEGNALNQLSNPYLIFVDHNRSVFVADGGNHRVMKWSAGATEGLIVAGGNGAGHELNQLGEPSSVIVDRMGTLYIGEAFNARITRWFKGSKEGIVIVGGRGEGNHADQITKQCDMAFDRDGNLWVADYFNHRIQFFAIDKSSCKSRKYTVPFLINESIIIVTF